MTQIEFSNKITTLYSAMEFFALSLTKNLESAGDLTQETCLKALKNKNKYRANTNFKAWVFTIMKNTFINNYNKIKRKQALIQSTEKHNQLLERKIDPSTHPEKHYILKEITAEIKKMRLDHRQPFTMHLEGYKYQEISEALDIPIGTVKSRIYLAKQALIKKFKGYEYRS